MGKKADWSQLKSKWGVRREIFSIYIYCSKGLCYEGNVRAQMAGRYLEIKPQGQVDPQQIMTTENVKQNNYTRTHSHTYNTATAPPPPPAPSCPIKLPPQWVESLHLKYSPISSYLNPGHMGHRDYLGKSCWRWQDPKKEKNTVMNLALSQRHWKEIGNWGWGGERGLQWQRREGTWCGGIRGLPIPQWWPVSVRYCVIL